MISSKRIGKKKIRHLTGLEYSEIDALIRRGQFPSMSLAGGWDEDVIQNWIVNVLLKNRLKNNKKKHESS